MTAPDRIAPDLPADAWPNRRPPADRRFVIGLPKRIDTALLKQAHPLDAVMLARGVKLGRVDGRGVREATCLCAAKPGRRPLWVNTITNTWGCLARGSVCGGDIFDYLEQVEGLGFRAALDALGGAATSVDPDTARRLEAERQERAAALAAEAAARDEAEREKAFKIWRAGAPAGGTLVDAYFRHRGLDPMAVKALRYAESEPYYWLPPGEAPPVVVHRGPCLLAAIQAPDGTFLGLHRTWLDPRLDPRLDSGLGTGACPADASGKAVIRAPDGTVLPAKKIRGGKKGGAIRLRDYAGTGTGRRGFVAGEGIETTATVLQGLLRRARRGIDWYGWAAGDLGNLSGGGLGPSTPHPDVPNRLVPSAEPDPSAPGLMPPPWADAAILLGDGDSDPHVTRARLACAQARWSAAGVPTEIVMALPGMDFNDMGRG